MEEPSEQSEDAPSRKPMTLSTLQRVGTSTFGVIATAAGTVAVFTTDNQAGSTALILIGALAFLVGMVGRFPDKITKEGVEYHQLEARAELGKAALDAVTSVVNNESLSREVRDIVATTVGEEVQRTSPTDGPDRPTNKARRFIRGMYLERDILTYISAHIPDGTALATDYLVGEPPETWRLDALLMPNIPEAASLAQGVAIDVNNGQSFSYTQTRILLERTASLKPGGFLHVVTFSLPETIKEDFSQLAKRAGLRNAHLVSDDFSSPIARRRLANAIEAAWAGVPYSYE